MTIKKRLTDVVYKDFCKLESEKKKEAERAKVEAEEKAKTDAPSQDACQEIEGADTKKVESEDKKEETELVTAKVVKAHGKPMRRLGTIGEEDED